MEKILIVDDLPMNREILTDMLDGYEIYEAENGREAIAQLKAHLTEISLVLLDMIMPEMDGLDVLEIMGDNGWLSDIPVIMISSDDSADVTHKAYELGCTEFIRRPFDALVVQKRCRNIIALYSKQKKLVDLFADQFYENEKNSQMMVDILAHIVEFRNNECGMHVINVQRFTEIILRELVTRTDKYDLTEKDIKLITNAAALHDIGKISIPDNILNKPGKLTNEEFQIMKSHSAAGAQMLDDLPFHKDEPIVRASHDIARWHHERWDGRGYPDGLKGDDIPIGAQVVSLADVYDALTAERCYKKAFSHETAIEMITKGECGQFNPLILECMNACSEQMRLVKEGTQNINKNDEEEIKGFARELLKNDAIYTSDRLLNLLEYEKMKNRFFEGITGGCSFEYSVNTRMLSFSKTAASALGVQESIIDPVHDKALCSILKADTLKLLSARFRASTPDSPIVQLYLHQYITGSEQTFRIDTAEDPGSYPPGTKCHTYRLICRTTWTLEAPQRYTGVIGKLVPNESAYGIMKGVDIFDIKGIL